MSYIDEAFERNSDAFGLITFPLSRAQQFRIIQMSVDPKLTDVEAIGNEVRNKLPDGVSVGEVRQAMDKIRARELFKRNEA